MANLFETKLGKLFPALGQLQKAGVTDEMWDTLGNSDGEYARVVYEALKAKTNESVSSNHGTITIPADATAEGLIADSKAEFKRAGIPIIYFKEELLQLVRKDLELVRGKTCKVFVSDFGRDWVTSEGRNFQKERGFDGNAAAHLVWVTKMKPMGWYVSIPNDDARLFCRSNDRLFAPGFLRCLDKCEFALDDVWCRWNSYAFLVGFSAI